MQGAPAYSPSHPPDKARGWGYRPAKRCRCANRRAGKGPERRPDPSPRRERERESGGGAPKDGPWEWQRVASAAPLGGRSFGRRLA